MSPVVEAGALGHLRTTSSHTIGIPHLRVLLDTLADDATHDDYVTAVLEENVLGRQTYAGRRRVLRHLCELYLLDPDDLVFRCLRVAHADDPAALPLLAALVAFGRDELFRSSWRGVATRRAGELVTADDLAAAVRDSGVTGLRPTTLAKVGRNTAASWTQTGHLVGRRPKLRQRVDANPAAVALAVTLGHLAGARAEALLVTPWFDLLDLPADARREALQAAHRRGLLDVRAAGSVLEIGVGPLTGGAR